jgi:cytoskeletal protein CcmA (bactofilin family)
MLFRNSLLFRLFGGLEKPARTVRQLGPSAVREPLPPLIQVVVSAGEKTQEGVKQPPKQEHKVSEPDKETVISQDAVLTGLRFESKSTLTVSGKLEGDILCRKLIIRAGGSVTGCVIAESMKNYGEFSGEARIGELLVYAGSTVSGTVYCRTAGIHPDATIDARIKCDRGLVPADAAPANNGPARTLQVLQHAGEVSLADDDVLARPVHASAG